MVNFSMDFLALYLTGKLLRLPVKGKRIAVAGVLGAGVATLGAIFSGNAVSEIIWMICYAVTAVTMCLIAFRGALRYELPVFLAVNLGLGGLMSFLCGMVASSGLRLDGGSDTFPVFVLFALISAGVCAVYGRLRPRGTSRKEADVVIELDGKICSMRMLVDSGNLLCEPLGGHPVLLAKPEALENLFGDKKIEFDAGNISALGTDLARRVRFVPAKGVGGEKLLVGFIPDRLTVDGIGRDGVVAAEKNDYGGCDGIVPSVLVG